MARSNKSTEDANNYIQAKYSDREHETLNGNDLGLQHLSETRLKPFRGHLERLVQPPPI
jgi:hypothetical protein